MSDKQSEKFEMSSVAEASTLLRRVAGPRGSGDNIKRLIERAARRVGFGYSRARDIWYQDARRIDSEEMDRLRDKAARFEAQETRDSLVAMRNRLAATDPEFHRQTIDALDSALRSMGAEVGALGLRPDRRRSLNNRRASKISNQYESA